MNRLLVAASKFWPNEAVDINVHHATLVGQVTADGHGSLLDYQRPARSRVRRLGVAAVGVATGGAAPQATAHKTACAGEGCDCRGGIASSVWPNGKRRTVNPMVV
jgi:hypothetical protein